MVARPYFNYSYGFIYQEWKSPGLCIIHVLFGGKYYYGRINRSFLVKRTTSRVVVVELGSTAALDGMFTIQNSHATTFHFQHNGLVYCVCGKLHITIASPRGYTGPSQAYIINHYTWHHQNYWTLFISGNHTTTRILSLQIMGCCYLFLSKG